MHYMKRREFIVALGGAAAGWPLVAQAQQARTPVLGFLGSAAEADYKTTTAALRRGLNEAGYVEKKNLLIDYRWADFQYERLPALAAELVKRPVDAIFATGSVVSALAAKSATATIPIVFANGSDPVQYGLVASLNRPGGNVTGISFIKQPAWTETHPAAPAAEPQDDGRRRAGQSQESERCRCKNHVGGEKASAFLVVPKTPHCENVI
jgi:ABC transporter substrate binding protein